MGVGSQREVVRHHGRATLGWFRCQPGEPGFGTGSTSRPIVVFPRTAVAIRHARREEVVADPATVMLYNAGDEYRRRCIDPIGDRCEWVSIPRPWWVEVCQQVDPAGRITDPRRDGGRLFTRDHGPSPTAAYLRQRRLTNAIIAGTASRLEVEETALDVIRDVLAAAVAATNGDLAAEALTRHRHRRLVHDVQEYLAATLADMISLDDVATAVGSSPYHLSRLFRAHTGSTIHAHRTHLRLRASLEQLPTRDLAAIAHDLGFSSHSHFTVTFRRAFGATPSQVRKILTA